MARSFGTTIALSVLAAALTSLAAVTVTAMVAYRDQSDAFYNELGTDIDQMRSAIELVLASESDPASRRTLLERLLNRYLMDDRFSCFRLRLAATELQIPPSRACAARRHDDTISLDLAGDEPGSLIIDINHSDFDQQRAESLKISGAVAAICLASFGLIGTSMLRANSRRERQLAERNLQTLVDASPMLMLELSPEGRILRASQSLQQLCAGRGLTIGSELSSLLQSDACREIMAMISRCSLNPAQPVSCDSTLSLLPQDHSLAQMGASLGINPMAREQSYLLTMTDVTAVVEEKQRFEAMVRFDFLTGALSRRALEDTHADGQRHRDYGLLMIDIDFFKSINDNFGHLIGDLYLQHAVRLLQQTLGSDGLVFRLSGEEFLALCEASDQASICEKAQQVCHRFVAIGLEADGFELKRTVSIGATTLRRDDQLSQALQIADFGLSLAKAGGRNRLRFVSRRDYLASERCRPSMEQVEAAINQAAIDLYLEQVVDCRTGQIEGFEALLRWPTADGTIAPLRFLESYYYVTNRVSSGKCRINLLNRVLQRLNFTGGDLGLWVSYNIIMSDFDPTSLALFAAIDPAYRKGLILEVSEQLLASRVDEETVARHLRELSALGFRIALDDFGVNGSNLGRLSLFPVDIVKLDKCLIQGIADSPINQSIVQSVCLLAQNLSIQVIAEGVETPIEAQMLQTLGIHLQQGYLYGRAVCAEDARRLIGEAAEAGTRTQTT